MTDADFLQTILANPDDDSPRLIYADWLEERSDPRAEFIRVQCEIACLKRDDPRRPPLQSRADILLKKHRKRWSETVRPLVKACYFRRGFIEAVDIGAEAFLANAKRLFESTPVRELHLSDLRDHVDRVADCRFLERIDSLQVGANRLGAGRMARLANSAHLHRVKSLTVAGNDIGVEGFRAIIVSPPLANLRRLEVASNKLGDAPILAVADCPALRRITHLFVANNELEHASWQALADSPFTDGLMFLDLGFHRVGNRGWRTLCAAPRWPKLKGLDLGGTDASETACLANWPTLAQLEVLKLNDNRFGAAGLPPLVNSPFAVNIKKLDLGLTRIGNDGIIVLVNSPVWIHLQRVVLRYCNISAEGARALLSRPKPDAMGMLNLSDNPIDEANLAELHSHFGAGVCVTNRTDVANFIFLDD